MVKVLLSLKWRHTLAGILSNTWSLVGTILGCLYLLGITLGLGVGMLEVGYDPQYLPLALAGLATIFSLIWWLGPLLTSNYDSALDPERLAPYPISRKELQLGQLLGSFISLQGIFTLLIFLTTLLAVRTSLPALLALLLALPLQLALLVVVSRLITLSAQGIASQNSAKILLGALGVSLLLFLGPILSGIFQAITSSLEETHKILDLLTYSPLASGLGFLTATYQGNYLLALAKLALSLAYLALFWTLWAKQLGHAMSHIGQDRSRRRKKLKQGQLGILSYFPATARGAITARTVKVLLTDSRASGNSLMVLIFMIGFTYLAHSNPEGFGWVSGLIMLTMAATTGYYFVSLISLDGSALAQHIYSPLTGKDDRWGRALGIIIVQLPLLLTGSTIMSLILFNHTYLPLNLSLVTGLFLSGLGLACLVDLHLSPPVAPPGSSIFKTPKNNDGLALNLIRMVTLFITYLLALPTWASYLAYHFTGHYLWYILTLVLGPLLGLGILLTGIHLGAQRFERHSPEALQRISSYTS